MSASLGPPNPFLPAPLFALQLESLYRLHLQNAEVPSDFATLLQLRHAFPILHCAALCAVLLYVLLYVLACPSVDAATEKGWLCVRVCLVILLHRWPFSGCCYCYPAPSTPGRVLLKRNLQVLTAACCSAGALQVAAGVGL
jgi:hypothetical protein